MNHTELPMLLYEDLNKYKEKETIIMLPSIEN
jgi:hypothetical protein